MAETAEQQESIRPMRDEFVRVRLTKAEARAVGRLVEMSGQPTLAAYVRSLIYQDARARKIRLTE